ncbi:MAG: helix-turn-helix transcriptional regulator [Phenylobacterium sp.]|nr:helix-turn-helix transcriptional regulator [Phenylobacterium sp.]MDP3868388.1 helix-turn-helix transcriptional regulator [Phenylobacterium sp.]
MRAVVAQNVRRYRLAKGMTQEALAEAAGFGQQYLSELETGKANPTVVTLYELGQQLGVTPAQLVTPLES